MIKKNFTWVLITGNFSTRFCFNVDPIDVESCVVGCWCAWVNIDGSSIAFARTIYYNQKQMLNNEKNKTAYLYNHQMQY